MSLLRRFFAPERRSVGVGTMLLFVMMSSHALLETARDALFLTKLPASQLPWVYFTVAMLSLGIVSAQNRIRKWMRNKASLAANLTLAAVSCLVFYLLPHTSPVLYALYVWVAVIATICVGQFWLLMSDRFYLSQAKRAFGTIASGGLAGATFGSMLSGLVVKTLGSESLILCGAGGLLLAGTVAANLPQALLDNSATSTEIPSSWGAEIWRHPLARKILGLVFISTLTLTLLDITFRAEIARQIAKENIGFFLAVFFSVLNLIALGTQLFLSSPLIYRMGTIRVLSILPAFILLGTAGFGVTLSFLPLLLAKAVDGSLRYSLHKTTLEILHVPLDASLRALTKSWGDSLGIRGGQGVASLLALALFTLGLFPRVTVALLCLAAGLWLLNVFRLRRIYVEFFRQQLQEDMVLTSAEVRDLDQASVETLIRTLNDPDEERVVHAVELLASREKAELIPAFILYHPAPRVVQTALKVLSLTTRKDYWKAAMALVESQHPELQRLAIAAYTRIAPKIDLEVLRNATGAADIGVRTSALVALMKHDSEAQQEAAQNLAWLTSGTEEKRAAILRAIREQNVRDFDSLLKQIAAGQSPDLGREVAALAAERKDPSFIPMLLPFLAVRSCRKEARVALVVLGEPAFTALARALSDLSVPSEIRRHIPRTLSRFPERQGSQAMLLQLREEKDSVVSYKLLRGLGRMMTEDPTLVLDPNILREIIDARIQHLTRLRIWRRTLGHEGVISTLLKGMEARTFEEISRLLGLMFPLEDFRSIHRSLLSKNERVRASSLELLENILVDPLKTTMLRLAKTQMNDRRGIASTGSEEALRDIHANTTGPLRPLAEELLQSQSAGGSVAV